MTSASADDAEKLGPGRIAAAIVLALFAVAFLVFTVIYLTTPDYKLPAHLGFRHSSGHHSLRGVACFLIGIGFAIGAWFALRYRSLALEEAQEAERAALAEAAAAPEATAAQVTASTGAAAGTAATVGDATASPGSTPGQSDGPGQQPTAASQA